MGQATFIYLGVNAGMSILTGHCTFIVVSISS